MKKINLDKELIIKSHSNIVNQYNEYYTQISDIMVLYKKGDTYYDMSREEWLNDEFEILLGLLGASTLLLNLYNTMEEYELSFELHSNMLKSYLLLTNEITPEIDNYSMFISMTDIMIESLKTSL